MNAADWITLIGTGVISALILYSLARQGKLIVSVTRIEERIRDIDDMKKEIKDIDKRLDKNTGSSKRAHERIDVIETCH